MLSLLPPAFILLAGAILIGPLKGHWRSAVLLAAPLLTLFAVWQVPDGVSLTLPFLGYSIEPLEGSALRRLFATIFALMAFVGGLYAFLSRRGTVALNPSPVDETCLRCFIPEILYAFSAPDIGMLAKRDRRRKAGMMLV